MPDRKGSLAWVNTATFDPVSSAEMAVRRRVAQGQDAGASTVLLCTVGAGLSVRKSKRPGGSRRMESKTEKYDTSQDSDSIGDLSKRLQQDLRKCAHSLGSYRPFSDRWLKMAEALFRIGNITKMEVALPKESKDATLWDCDELALRFLLEDGKLNLVLRNLIGYKTLERDMLLQGKSPKDEFKVAARHFESGSGVTLKHAWLHIEALQTTDLPMMVEYIAGILAAVVEYPARMQGVSVKLGDTDPDDLQEKICPHYILALMKGLDAIEEDRIMPSVRRFRLLPMFIRFLQLHHAVLSEDTLKASCEALSIIFDTDDFQTNEERYIPDDDLGDTLAELGDLFVHKMATRTQT